MQANHCAVNLQSATMFGVYFIFMAVHLAVVKVRNFFSRLQRNFVKLAQTNNKQIKKKGISFLLTLLFCTFPGFSTWSQAFILYCMRTFEWQKSLVSFHYFISFCFVVLVVS